mgnify:CR=1 FL=1
MINCFDFHHLYFHHDIYQYNTKHIVYKEKMDILCMPISLFPFRVKSLDFHFSTLLHFYLLKIMPSKSKVQESYGFDTKYDLHVFIPLLVYVSCIYFYLINNYWSFTFYMIIYPTLKCFFLVIGEYLTILWLGRILLFYWIAIRVRIMIFHVYYFLFF